jgi:hypothetical protein
MAKHENRTIKISGGTFTGPTNVAAGDITVGSVRQEVRLADLRAALEAHRAELIAAGGDDGEKVRGRLERLDEELAEDEPDADVVRGGWRSLAKLLTGAGAAAEAAKKIAELVQALFP